MMQLTMCKRMASAALAVVSVMGIGAPAKARGIVADTTPAIDLACDAVACGVSTPGAPISFGGANFYVYTDGYISVGAPLPNPPGGKFPAAPLSVLPRLGNNYIAAGLYPYRKGKGIPIKVQYRFTTTSGPGLQILYGIPSGLYEIYLKTHADGSFTAAISEDNIATLPNNALIGSNYSGCQTVVLVTPATTCDYPYFTYAPFKPGLAKANKKYKYPDIVLTIPPPH